MRYAPINISRLLLSILIISSLIFTSCEQDTETFPAPTIKFNTDYLSSDSTVLLNDTVIISIIAETNSNDPLTQFNISVTKDTETISLDSGIYSNSFIYERQIVKGLASTESWSFYVRDRESRQSETITLNLHLDSASFYGDIIEYQSIILGAQENTIIGSFYSLSENQVYTAEEASNIPQLINIAYFFDLIEGEDNTISSPGANIDESVYPLAYHPNTWSTRNTTRYELSESISVDEFNSCSNDSLILANTFEFNSGKRKAKNLSPNDIYSFVTDDGKKGLFKVNVVNGEEAGTIDLTIKMQE